VKPWNSHTQVLRLSIVWMAAWLAGALALAVAQGHWPTYVHAWPARIGFLIFGPIGEELLFRGIVQERARQVWRRPGTPAILISTAAFSLHHLFIHTAPAGLLVAQLLFTLPMGIVFATLRERTGSLWPGVALHVLTNLPFAF
jgi:membrane protease YdiL (CAAX protease family)